MNRAKLLEFFDATTVKDTITIIGVGAVGSHIATTLARLGFEVVHLYDFDKVEAHNITNQNYDQEDIGLPKVSACAKHMRAINPDMRVVEHDHAFEIRMCDTLAGHVFLCVDNIDLRRDITQTLTFNPQIKSIQDYRMRLTDAQYYFATEMWERNKLLQTMNYTHEEAAETTPHSACGYELSVVYTIQFVVAAGIANWIMFLLGKEEWLNIILTDSVPADCVKIKWKKKTLEERLKRELKSLGIAAERSEAQYTQL